jgi:hypothetical protein
MKNDLNKTFGRIFDDDVAALREQLIEIQCHHASRKEAEEWVEHLRFLDISNVPNLSDEYVILQRKYASLPYLRTRLIKEAQTPCHLPITRRSNDDGVVQYVAVSWKWSTNRKATPCSVPWRPMYNYMIKRPDAEPHKSEFPDEYLERVIMFAQRRGITKLWIDKECIYQRKGDDLLYPNDHDNGVQIMDIVYGDSAASVGLLSTPLISQDDLDTLAKLLSRKLFQEENNTHSPKLVRNVDLPKVYLLLLRIFSDARWSRGWIFQEDHLASVNMTLLIPCDKKFDRNGEHDFGEIPDEVEVDLVTFKRSVTMFCLASSESEESWPNSDFLAKAKQYKIWNKKMYAATSNQRDGRPVRLCYEENLRFCNGGAEMNTVNNYSNVSCYPTMTNSVLDDICNRTLENDEDRIAILANALKYSRRLNIRTSSPLMKPGQYSLSAALLALILMNGEIILNSEYEDLPMAKDIMDHTLRSYLKRCEYKFNASTFCFEQYWINHCRFKPTQITKHGMETKGFLFELLPRYKPSGRGSLLNPVRFNDNDRSHLAQLPRGPASVKIPPGKKLNIVAREAYLIVIDKLNKVWPGGRLARYLEKHLELDRNPPSPGKAALSTRYVLDTMVAVYQALLDDRDLRLARFALEPDTADPVGIFIAPVPHGWSTDYSDGTGEQPLRVFTSWNRPCSAYDRESLASLEVAVCDKKGVTNEEEDDNTCYLRSYGWVNGVWCVRGKHMETYGFPLPGISEELKTHDILPNSRKRRRSDEEENAEDSSSDW